MARINRMAEVVVERMRAALIDATIEAWTGVAVQPFHQKERWKARRCHRKVGPSAGGPGGGSGICMGKILLTHKTEPKFSQPIRQILMMVVALALTALVSFLLYSTVATVFQRQFVPQRHHPRGVPGRRDGVLLAGVHADRRGELDGALRMTGRGTTAPRPRRFSPRWRRCSASGGRGGR